MVSEGLNQHYVPKLYLKRFTGEGNTFTHFDIERSRWIRNKGPSAICKENYLHSDWMERGMGKFEKKASDALDYFQGRDYVSKKSMNEKFFLTIYRFAVFQIVRNPDFINKICVNISNKYREEGIRVQGNSEYIQERALRFCYSELGVNLEKHLLKGRGIWSMKGGPYFGSDFPVITLGDEKEKDDDPFGQLVLPISKTGALILAGPSGPIPAPDLIRSLSVRNANKFLVCDPSDEASLSLQIKQEKGKKNFDFYRNMPFFKDFNRKTTLENIENWNKVRRDFSQRNLRLYRHDESSFFEPTIFDKNQHYFHCLGMRSKTFNSGDRKKHDESRVVAKNLQTLFEEIKNSSN